MKFANVADQLAEAFALGHAAHAYIVVAESQQLPQLLWQCAAVCMCTHHNGNDNCENCRKVSRRLHQDVLFFPKEDKTRLAVADIAELVEETFKRPVDSGSNRVFLLNAAKSVAGTGAEVWQNKLLKTLEEPTENNFVFVGVTDAESLLPTVRSRCQVLKQGKSDEQTVCNQLLQGGFQLSVCQVAAAVSGGSLHRAQAVMANPAVLRAFDNAKNMLVQMTSTKNALPHVAAALNDKENLSWFLHFVALLLRESVVFRLAEQLCLLSEHRQDILEICKNYSLQAAEVCTEEVCAAAIRLEEGGNPAVVMDKLANTMLEVKYRCRT